MEVADTTLDGGDKPEDELNYSNESGSADGTQLARGIETQLPEATLITSFEGDESLQQKGSAIVENRLGEDVGVSHSSSTLNENTLAESIEQKPTIKGETKQTSDEQTPVDWGSYPLGTLFRKGMRTTAV